MVILVNTFLPILLVLLAVWGGYRAWAWGEQRLIQTKASAEKIIQSALEAKASVVASTQKALAAADQAREKGQAIVARINGMSDAVGGEIQKVAGAFKKAAAVITSPIPNIAGARDKARRELEKLFAPITAPFVSMVRQFKAVGADLSEIQEEIAAIAAELNHLKGLEKYLDAVIAEYEKIRENTIAALAFLSKAVRVVVGGLVLLGAWMCIGFGFWFLRRVATGMAMVRGRAVSV